MSRITENTLRHVRRMKNRLPGTIRAGNDDLKMCVKTECVTDQLRYKWLRIKRGWSRSVTVGWFRAWTSGFVIMVASWVANNYVIMIAICYIVYNNAVMVSISFLALVHDSTLHTYSHLSYVSPPRSSTTHSRFAPLNFSLLSPSYIRFQNYFHVKPPCKTFLSFICPQFHLCNSFSYMCWFHL